MTDKNPWYQDISTPALLRHARNTYGGAMRQALEEAGFEDIPGNGLYLIGGLAQGAGDAPLGQLVRELRITKQAAGQLVDTLVSRGYLQRTVDEQDRRKLVVSLTERGQAAAEVQTQARQRIDQALLARCGQAEVDSLRHGLATLIELGREARD
ncbi:MarR family transcriptional regulator [Gallaecimonas kandeliae]|uniref:MarR family winged helix-turn-helix transcriptional regulator n=1 Tax=Gallaecimonas kandeliae TaxID=3029055 RepID=UPI00264A0EA9|nr:MarR family transcriptional regulator [Gallaecimonas kandeliae]WKE65437.1 MarR family transcriptional regulator [Gallaecimonas kandeliae]